MVGSAGNGKKRKGRATCPPQAHAVSRAGAVVPTHGGEWEGGGGGGGGKNVWGFVKREREEVRGEGKKRGEENNSVGEETARGERAMSGV